jgi:hypothetical protein
MMHWVLVCANLRYLLEICENILFPADSRRLNTCYLLMITKPTHSSGHNKLHGRRT